jgi:hypothetical protein
MHPQTFISYLLLVTSIIFTNVLAAPLPHEVQTRVSQSLLGQEKQNQANEKLWCGVPGIWIYPCDWNTEDVGMHKGVFKVFLWCKWIVSTPSNLAGTFGILEVENSGTTTSSLESSHTTTQHNPELVRIPVVLNEEHLTAEEVAVLNKTRRSSINVLSSKIEKAAAAQSCSYYGYTGAVNCVQIARGSSLSTPRIFALPTLVINILSSIPRTIAGSFTSLQSYTKVELSDYRLAPLRNLIRGHGASKGSAFLVPWVFGFPEMKFGALATLGLAGFFAVFM